MKKKVIIGGIVFFIFLLLVAFGIFLTYPIATNCFPYREMSPESMRLKTIWR